MVEVSAQNWRAPQTALRKRRYFDAICLQFASRPLGLSTCPWVEEQVPVRPTRYWEPPRCPRRRLNSDRLYDDRVE